MVSSLAFNDQREQMEPENCCNGILRTTDAKVVRAKYMTWGDVVYFELALSDEDAQGLVEDQEMIDEWMKKVTHGGWQGGGQKYSGGTFRSNGWFNGLFGH